MRNRNSKPNNNKFRNNKKFAAKKEASIGNYQDAFADEQASKFPRGKAMPKSNDPQWYFKDPQLLRDVASFSYNNPLGSKLWPNVFAPEDTWSTWAATIPGLMATEIGPCIGVAQDAQSPINLAAVNLYSYVRYKNSGAANYDAPDLMIYMIAMDSLYMAWNWMKRLYGFASAYSQVNKYKPRAYFMANNVDFDDFISNLANFRAYLNMAADRISAFCVPATLTYNVRHSWLFSNVYKDSNTAKAQEYMYVPSWFYQFSETSSPSGGVLEVVPVLLGRVDNSAAAFKTADLINLLNTMINRMSYSEDAGIMSGDILKAYESNLFKLSHVDADYVVDAVYSAEVLSQIENMNIVDNPATIITSQFTIVQDPDLNILKCTPQFPIDTSENALHPLTAHGSYVNMHHDSPTPEETIVATRLILTEEPNTAGTQMVITSMGSEFAVKNRVYFYAGSLDPTQTLDATSPLVLAEFSLTNTFIEVQQTSTPLTVIKALYSVWAQYCFDWAPHYYTGIMTISNGNIKPLFQLADWDVYTYIANEQLQAMNELALLTEFNVPN